MDFQKVINDLKQKTILKDTSIKFNIFPFSWDNAYSRKAPDGTYHISLTKGAIKHSSKDELLGALAHELGHLVAVKKHPQLMHDNELKNKVTSLMTLWSNIYCISSFILTFILLYKLCTSGVNILISSILAFIFLTFSVYFSIYLGIFTGNLFLKPYYKHMQLGEYNADLIGSKIIGKKITIQSLKNITRGETKLQIWWNTWLDNHYYNAHPSMQNRIKNIKYNGCLTVQKY